MYIAQLLPLPTVAFASAAGSRRSKFNPPKRTLFQRFAQPALLLSVLSSGLSSDQARTRTVPSKPPITQPDSNQTDWSDVRTLKPEGTPEDQEYFASLFRYCEEKGIDLQEAVAVAAKIRPSNSTNSLTPREKAHALMIAAILLEIQNDTTNSFYARPEYKNFIDTVLRYIMTGKLKIKADRLYEIASAVYSPESNTVRLFEPLDLLSQSQKTTVLHELFHFFQDIQGKPIPYLQVEVEAYLMVAEYQLISADLYHKTTPTDKFEAYINKVILERPSVNEFAMRATFARLQGDETKYQENRKTIEKVIKKQIFLLLLEDVQTDPIIRKHHEELLEAAAKKVADEKSKKQFLIYLRQEINRHKASKKSKLKALTEFFKKRPLNDRSEKENAAVGTIMRQLFQLWILINFSVQLEDLVARHDNAAEMLKELNETAENALAKRLHTDMYNEIQALEPALNTSPINGVD